LTVKTSADFAAASKNSGKNICCLLKIDITSVVDANENEHTSRRYTVVFSFVLVIKFKAPIAARGSRGVEPGRETYF